MRFRSLLLGLCVATPLVYADVLVATEGAMQSALLVNFAAYTEWPAVPVGAVSSEKLLFCVMGSPEVADALNNRQRKTVHGKILEVKTITSAAQASACQVLFIGKDEHKRIREVALVTLAIPLLMVAEEGGFDPSDVTISLRLEDGRYTFKINQSLAQTRSLALSSKLLKLAARVY